MSLESFINKFNNADGKYVYTIDPLKTFDVDITFNNGTSINAGGQSPLQTGIASLLNNVTGGLAGKAMNNSKNKMKAGYADILAVASDSLFTDINGMSMNLKYFVQEATIPEIQVPDDAAIETVLGTFKSHKMVLDADNKEFSLRILDTKVPLIERIFYPWMREVSYPYWSYAECPYTTATVSISMKEHNDIAYVFLGSRPKKIETLKPTNQLDLNMSRSVTFAFDFMCVDSAGNNIESIKDSLMNTGKSIINKAAGMIGL